MKNLTVLGSSNEDKYNELLRQPVAVIEASRLQIAKQLNTVAMSSYWEIGKLLEEKKIDSKHGDGIVKRLSVDLKSKYPDLILHCLLNKLIMPMKCFAVVIISDSLMLLTIKRIGVGTSPCTENHNLYNGIR